MYVRMHVCRMYMRICVSSWYTATWTCRRTHVCMRVGMDACPSDRLCAFIHVHMPVRTHVCMCARTCMPLSMYEVRQIAVHVPATIRLAWHAVLVATSFFSPCSARLLAPGLQSRPAPEIALPFPRGPCEELQNMATSHAIPRTCLLSSTRSDWAVAPLSN